MGRIRQQFPQNYTSSANVSLEFENLVRYLVAAERGGKTLGELVDVLFDDDGEFTGPIEMRRDLSGDIQYRVGSYLREDEGWTALVSGADLRGASGINAGEIGTPLMHSRHDAVPANGATIVSYAHGDTDELLVFIDGVLQREGAEYDYTTDPGAGTITFTAAFNGTEAVTIYKIQSSLISGYRRTDIETTASQTVFAFIHDEQAQLNVYLNGILQREGGSYDYVTSPATDTVTFNNVIPAGNLITIFTVENTAAQVVTGLMTEIDFVDLPTGLIRLDKVKVDDGALPQAKVANLTTELGERAKLTVSATTPVSPGTGDLWLDTAQAPNQMKFWDGASWLRLTPDSSLPTFTTTDAKKTLRVNGTGTGLEFANPDLSSVIPTSQRGVANGVATLDAQARLPVGQLPEALGTDTLYRVEQTPSNSTYVTKRIFREKLRLDGISVMTTSGTCTVQVAVNGVGTGPTYSVSSTPLEQNIATPIEVDATAASATIGFIVTGNASAAKLEVAIAATVLLS
jgi:hypothetical protein